MSDTMRVGRRGAGSGGVAALLGLGLLAAAPVLEAADLARHASGTQGRPVLSEEAPAGATVLWEEDFGFVRLEPAEAGAAPNQHPVGISPGQIQAALGSLRLGGGEGPEPVFSDAELEDIAPALSEALARARPDQDVAVAVTGRSGALSLLSPRHVTTARVFVGDGALNVILGLVHAQFEGRFRQTGQLRTFHPGSRRGPVEGDVDLLAGPGVQPGAPGRGDWVRIAPAVLAGQTAAPATLPAVGLAPAAPVAAPLLGGAAAGDDYYLQFKRRLEALKRLRADGLITEQEFQDKRRSILQEF